MVWLSGIKAGLGLLGTVPYTTTASYALSVVPLFVLMGEFAFHSGLSKDIYYAVYRWLGSVRGGLSMATIGACSFFAAISGSSLATAATMGTVALPEMQRYKYDPALATGCIAAGGTLGILIPPSVVFIVYGIITEQSIGKLFIAGLFPGILLAVLFMLTIYIITGLNPQMGPPGPKTSFVEKVKALKGVWAILVLFVVVIGGIYLGIFTPTEAAGVGAFGAFLFVLGRRKFTWQNFIASLTETVKVTAMIFVILIGAMILGYFLAVTRLPFELATFASELPIPPLFIFILITWF